MKMIGSISRFSVRSSCSCNPLLRGSGSPWRHYPYTTLSAARRSARTSSGGNIHSPPLIVRGALVGASGLVVTAGAGFVFYSVGGDPACAPMFLPIAASNGVTAAAVYTVADIVAGGPARLLPPVGGKSVARPGGPMIGIATALLAPLTYATTWALIWQDGDAGPRTQGANRQDGDADPLARWISQGCKLPFNSEINEVVWSTFFSSEGIRILAGMGLCLGAVLQTGGRELVFGRPGVPWRGFSITILYLAVLGMGILYYTGRYNPIQAGRHLRDTNSDRGCFVNGTKELCWVPGLDFHTGAVVSRCRDWVPQYETPDRTFYELRMTKMYVDGYFSDNCTDTYDGPERFEDSIALRDKIEKHQNIPIYASKNHITWCSDPIPSSEIGALAAAIPVGEAIVTDALVALVMEKAPQHVVASSLAQLTALPSARDGVLLNSALAERLRELKPRSGLDATSWAFGKSRNPARVVDALFYEMNLRGAQLREIWRIDHGYGEGAYAREDLVASLMSGGVEVERALKALEDLRWSPPPRAADAEVERVEDWMWFEYVAQKKKARTWKQDVLWPRVTRAFQWLATAALLINWASTSG